MIRTSIRGTVSNNASISHTNPLLNTNTSNDRSSVSITVIPRSDISVRKSVVTAAPYVPGESRVIYSIIIDNLGFSDAPSTNITDNIPAIFSNINWNCSTAAGCSPSSGTTNSLSTTFYLASSQSATIIIEGDLLSSVTGSFTNVISSWQRDDTNSSNDQSNTTITMTPRTDISIIKTITPTNIIYIPGQTYITYSIIVMNLGPSDIYTYNATLVDSFTAYLTDVTWSCPLCAISSVQTNTNVQTEWGAVVGADRKSVV